MAITVTDIGAATAASSTVSVTAPVGGVPAGSLIYIGVSSGNGSVATTAPTAASVSDGTNTYTRAASKGSTAAGTIPNVNFIASFFVANSTALTSSAIFTFNSTSTSTAGNLSGISVFYASGVSTTPLDGAVTATASGTSTNVSVASGTPGTANELIVGLVDFINNTGVAPSYTQATGFTTPPDVATRLNFGVGGGNLIASTAQTFAPAWSVAPGGGWFAQVVGFKPFSASAAVTPLRMLVGVGV